MSVTFNLDRKAHALRDAGGRRFVPERRCWVDDGSPLTGDTINARAAVGWLQRDSGAPLRIPVGVIGPRDATPAQLEAAERVGEGLAAMGLVVVCGGRQGVMEAACRGAAKAGGLSIGILPDAEPAYANPHVSLVLATGIGEARNALITRAALCLVAVGDSFGTLSEVAFGRQFGKLVVGLEGAAEVDGVVRVPDADAACETVARFVLGVP